MRANQWTGPHTLAEQFWSRVTPTAEGCWEWAGLRHPKGYGSLSSGGRLHVAHRVSYELHNGPIPAGLLVCHHCDNPPCVNPAHLFVGTPADNTRDMIAKGRHAHGPVHSATMRRVASRGPRGPRDLGPLCKNGHDRATYMRPNGPRSGRACSRCHADRELVRHHARRAAR